MKTKNNIDPYEFEKNEFSAGFKFKMAMVVLGMIGLIILFAMVVASGFISVCAATK